MTLRSLGSGSWRLDIQNTTTAPVTIKQVTWSAPDGLTVERWYDLAQEHRRISPPEGQAVAGLRERFDAAVAARLVSDVPVGVFLSSGIDSALVAASVAASGAIAAGRRGLQAHGLDADVAEKLQLLNDVLITHRAPKNRLRIEN